MQIQVLKANGAYEPYLHTKVLGTLHKAMSQVDPECLEKAQSIADAITCYLYHPDSPQEVTTDHIHHLIVQSLDSTGHGQIAETIETYRLERNLQRHRIEVVDGDRIGWNKALVASWLIDHYGVDCLMARTIAGAVEEQVIQLGLTRIRKNLIKHLTVTNAEILLEASLQLDEVPMATATVH